MTRRLDLVALGWGGLVTSVGLMAAGSRELYVRLVVVGAAALLGGFLAGVRASARRPVHGAVAVIVAHLIFAAFVALASFIGLFVDPEAPDLLPGGAARTGGVALWAIAFGLVGGVVAGSWLRPAGAATPRRRGRSRGVRRR